MVLLVFDGELLSVMFRGMRVHYGDFHRHGGIRAQGQHSLAFLGLRGVQGCLSDSWPLRLAAPRVPEAEYRSRGTIRYPKERGRDQNR